MKKLLEPRIWSLLLAVVGLVALGLLSPALRQLTFQPPLPFSLAFGGSFGLLAIGGGQNIPAWKITLFGGLLLVILVALFLLLDPQERKRLLLQILRISLGFGLAAWLLSILYNRGIFQNLMRIGTGEAGANASAQSVLLDIAVPQVNPWLVFVVSFGIGLGLVLVGWRLYTHRRRLPASSPMDEVVGIVNDALRELDPGQNWDDAIVRAYVRMNEVVMAERHVWRQPGSTPREFARRMEQMGLPGEALRTLTDLFERVRYGGNTSSPAERERAAAALSAIAQACGRRP